ncbi:hypothetical protein ACE6ED_16475 [Paenibacillus sp. CN-4]|uniref:hypothetical protein n=1 Tax=Paenibacillus nanchangensis TaxID=3348343 RepID=UPI0039793639
MRELLVKRLYEPLMERLLELLMKRLVALPEQRPFGRLFPYLTAPRQPQTPVQVEPGTAGRLRRCKKRSTVYNVSRYV